MKKWVRQAIGAVVILAGAALFLHHILSLLDWPHLYPDLRQLSLTNVLFLALTLLLCAIAWISGAYLLLNKEDKILFQLLPGAVFILALLLGGLCATRTVGEVPCSYTRSLAVCVEEFDSENFRVRGKPLYPGYPMGELTGYARYEKGDVLAESVTRSYDQDGYFTETARLESLGLEGFCFSQDPRERESTCYELRLGDSMWQVLLVPKTKIVTYSRYQRAEELPSFAPQPTDKPDAAQPVTAPATAPVTAPVTEPVTEPETDSTAETTAEPTEDE